MARFDNQKSAQTNARGSRGAHFASPTSAQVPFVDEPPVTPPVNPYARGVHGAPGQPPQPRKKGGKGIVIAAVLLMVIGVGLLAVALGMYLTSQHNYQQNEQEYSQLQQNVTEDTVTSEPIVDFATLKSENPEVVGWIQVPGTPVNYPVVQHADNDYYLDHSFLGRYDLFGAIYMDYRSKANLSDRTTVIYGHHLKNGNMFARLADYSDQAEFDTLGDFYYVTEDGTVHILTPLACMVVDGYDVDSVRTDFADDADFTAYVQSLLDRSSAVATGASAAGVNHLYLLSTCSYARDNDRTILIATDKAAGSAVTDASQDLQAIQQAADEAAVEATGGVEAQAEEAEWVEPQPEGDVAAEA